MPTQPTSRFGFIDAARGIAACLVVLQHSLYASGLLGNLPLTGFIPTWLELGETGVVTFFLVSGFVIPLSLEKTNNFRLFWIHRALRIYPLYLAVFVATVALSWGGDLKTVGDFAKNVLAHLFFVQEYLHQENFVGGSWTLSLELVWYVVISALFLVSLNKKIVLLTTAAVLAAVVAQLMCALGHHLPMGRLSMLICCVLGLVFYRYDRGDITLKRFLVLAGLLVISIFMNLFVGLQLFPAENPTAHFQMAAPSWVLGGLVFSVPFFTRHKAIWSHGLFNFLGRISYSVYLVHGLILPLIEKYTPIKGVLLILVVFAVTIGISVLTYRFIENPPIRFGHRLKKSHVTDGGKLSPTEISPK